MKQDLTPHDLTVRDIAHAMSYIQTQAALNGLTIKMRRKGKGAVGQVIHNDKVIFETYQEFAFQFLNTVYVIYHMEKFFRASVVHKGVLNNFKKKG